MIKPLISFIVIITLFGCTTTPDEKLNQVPKQSSPRHQIHYLYAHIVLPRLFLFKPEQTLALIETDGNNFLRFILDDLQKNIKIDEKLDSSKLTYSIMKEDKYKLVIITLPQPLVSPEAYYVAMVVPNKGYNRDSRYFTLEKIADSGEKQLDSFFCEWTSKLHKNYGIGLVNPPTIDDFLLLIRQFMEKTATQLDGILTKNKHHFLKSKDST